MSGLFKSLLLVLEGALSLLFPMSEDERLIKGVSKGEFLKKLQVRERAGCVVLTHFDDPQIRAAIHLVKFHQNQHATELAAVLLQAWLEAHAPEQAVIIPLPLSKTRLRQRGFNQSEVIVRVATKKQTLYEVNNTALSRNRHSAPQSSLTKKERATNVANAFKVTNPKSLQGKHLILVDDVMTTGATLKAAKAALMLCKPASVTCVAIAH